MTPAPSPRVLLAVAVGGALGAVLRWALGDLVPDGTGYAWTTFAINLSGAFLLALLPAVNPVRRSQVLAVALGPGLLGGFTTLSAYSEQSRSLLADGRTALAGTYLLGTLVACLVAVELASRFVTPIQQRSFEVEGGDE